MNSNWKHRMEEESMKEKKEEGAKPGLVEQAPKQVPGSPCPVLATSVRKMPSRPFDESNINVMKVQL